MAIPSRPLSQNKYSEQNMGNTSFDETYGVNSVELVAEDNSSGVLRRVQVNSSGNLVTASSSSLTSGFFGQAKIAVTGTAVQLATNTLTNGVIITALSTNSGIIKIGGSGVTNVSDGTGNGYLLEAGGSISVASTNTNVLYINGTAGDIISFMAC